MENLSIITPRIISKPDLPFQFTVWSPVYAQILSISPYCALLCKRWVDQTHKQIKVFKCWPLQIFVPSMGPGDKRKISFLLNIRYTGAMWGEQMQCLLWETATFVSHIFYFDGINLRRSRTVEPLMPPFTISLFAATAASWHSEDEAILYYTRECRSDLIWSFSAKNSFLTILLTNKQWPRSRSTN